MSIIYVLQKLSTSLHAVFNLIFGTVCFVIVIFSIHGPKMQFSESSQNSMSEKSVFGHFEVIFSTYNFFPGRELFFLVITFKKKFFNEKMSSLAGLRKKLFIFLHIL